MFSWVKIIEMNPADQSNAREAAWPRVWAGFVCTAPSPLLTTHLGNGALPLLTLFTPLCTTGRVAMEFVPAEIQLEDVPWASPISHSPKSCDTTRVWHSQDQNEPSEGPPAETSQRCAPSLTPTSTSTPTTAEHHSRALFTLEDVNQPLSLLKRTRLWQDLCTAAEDKTFPWVSIYNHLTWCFLPGQ